MGETIAVLGLGEAGSCYARDLLAAGFQVAGYDPVARPVPDGLRRCGSPADAAGGAAVVLSLTSAGAAEQAAEQAAAGLAAGAVFADMNTSAPAAKRRVAAALEGTGAWFVDVAVLAPVSRSGLRTPLALAGPGRARLAALLAPLGVPLEDAGAEPGAAAERKLLRSVFMKGLAAVVLESLEVAARAGQEPWLRGQIAAELAAADGALLDRLVEGTRRHAQRRLEEMRAAAAHADALGASSPMLRATVARLERLVAERDGPPAP